MNIYNLFSKDIEYEEKLEHYPFNLAKYIRKHCALQNSLLSNYDFFDMVDKCNVKIN